MGPGRTGIQPQREFQTSPSPPGNDRQIAGQRPGCDGLRQGRLRADGPLQELLRASAEGPSTQCIIPSRVRASASSGISSQSLLIPLPDELAAVLSRHLLESLSARRILGEHLEPELAHFVRGLRPVGHPLGGCWDCERCWSNCRKVYSRFNVVPFGSRIGPRVPVGGLPVEVPFRNRDQIPRVPSGRTVFSPRISFPEMRMGINGQQLDIHRQYNGNRGPPPRVAPGGKSRA